VISGPTRPSPRVIRVFAASEHEKSRSAARAMGSRDFEPIGQALDPKHLAQAGEATAAHRQSLVNRWKRKAPERRRGPCAMFLSCFGEHVIFGIWAYNQGRRAWFSGRYF